MLVLSRKIDEVIVIADNIHVRVIAVSGKQIRLGITAPREISVQRKEIQRKTEVFQQHNATALAGK